MVSIFLRSLAYNVLFYALLVFWILVAVPTFLMPRRAFMAVAKTWARSSVWLMRVICNTKLEVRGLEKIPDGPLIVASKHQSMWETFALMPFFDAPLFIYKRELAWIPFFGWYLMKSGMIGVDRSGGLRSLMEMARRAPKEIRSGRQLIIFPEGTRTPVGAPPDYMTGVGQIYTSSGVPCLPVALNSGLFWPRRTFMRYPGTLVVEFLDPLPAGLTRKEFIVRIATVIEAATNRLVEAAREEQAQLFGRVPSAPSGKKSSFSYLLPLWEKVSREAPDEGSAHPRRQPLTRPTRFSVSAFPEIGVIYAAAAAPIARQHAGPDISMQGRELPQSSVTSPIDA